MHTILQYFLLVVAAFVIFSPLYTIREVYRAMSPIGKIWLVAMYSILLIIMVVLVFTFVLIGTFING